jgi:hypothetical protein
MSIPGRKNGAQSRIRVKVTDPVRVTVIRQRRRRIFPAKPCWFPVNAFGNGLALG